MPIYTPIFKKSTEFLHINNNYLKFIIKLIAGYKINIYMCNMKIFYLQCSLSYNTSKNNIRKCVRII